MPKITKSVVEQAQPRRTQNLIWDSDVKGFGVRVTPAGAKSYVFQYRHSGQPHRITIGRVNSIEPGKARNIAKQYAAMVAEGRDPKAEKDGAKARATAERQRERDTVEKVIADFIEKHAKPKNRSWRKTQAIFERHVLPVWG